jgi:hypothetical protein
MGVCVKARLSVLDSWLEVENYVRYSPSCKFGKYSQFPTSSSSTQVVELSRIYVPRGISKNV